jgi:hypothetical protein
MTGKRVLGVVQRIIPITTLPARSVTLHVTIEAGPKPMIDRTIEVHLNAEDLETLRQLTEPRKSSKEPQLPSGEEE